MSVKIDKGFALDNLNLTPLIDVVFNLLIFFLVAPGLAEAEREMDVMLPEASEARPLRPSPARCSSTSTGTAATTSPAKRSTSPNSNRCSRRLWCADPAASRSRSCA